LLNFERGVERPFQNLTTDLKYPTMLLPEPSKLALFMLSALALVLMPGPATLYIMARSINQGRRAGFTSVLGIASGNVVHITAAALGLSALLLSSALAFTAVKYLGAAYLIYLGIRKLCDREDLHLTPTLAPDSLRQIFFQGFVVNALNPKAALFFIAFLPQFIEPAKGAVPLQVIALGLVFTAVASCGDSFYALVSGTIGQWLKGNARFRRSQKYVAGGTYIGLGMATALSGSHTN
jgi:threonine/homoserine/homoserine lactone efflux protein